MTERQHPGDDRRDEDRQRHDGQDASRGHGNEEVHEPADPAERVAREGTDPA